MPDDGNFHWKCSKYLCVWESPLLQFHVSHSHSSYRCSKQPSSPNCAANKQKAEKHVCSTQFATHWCRRAKLLLGNWEKNWNMERILANTKESMEDRRPQNTTEPPANSRGQTEEMCGGGKQQQQLAATKKAISQIDVPDCFPVNTRRRTPRGGTTASKKKKEKEQKKPWNCCDTSSSKRNGRCAGHNTNPCRQAGRPAHLPASSSS